MTKPTWLLLDYAEGLTTGRPKWIQGRNRAKGRRGQNPLVAGASACVDQAEIRDPNRLDLKFGGKSWHARTAGERITHLNGRS